MSIEHYCGDCFDGFNYCGDASLEDHRFQCGVCRQNQIMNNKIDLKVSPSYDFERHALKITTTTSGQISEKVLQLEDKAIREALIALGWTPPKCGLEEAFDELDELDATLEDEISWAEINGY